MAAGQGNLAHGKNPGSAKSPGFFKAPTPQQAAQKLWRMPATNSVRLRSFASVRPTGMVPAARLT